jgi:hypothetical protein
VDLTPSEKPPLVLRQEVEQAVEIGLREDVEHLLEYPLGSPIDGEPVVYYGRSEASERWQWGRVKRHGAFSFARGVTRWGPARPHGGAI